MEMKLEGRHVELGAEIQERITKKLNNLDQRFGPVTHARVTVERKSRKNEKRASATLVINIAGKTLSVSKEAATVVAAVNEGLDGMTHELQTYVEKKRKTGKGGKSIREDLVEEINQDEEQAP